mmetsp:Transcript_35660/g.114027  ORF Transcript_35660/g.114027 Transcript_35660/m.114027 type:complete len:441 (+) Transcript_35660:98-1420(+)
MARLVVLVLCVGVASSLSCDGSRPATPPRRPVSQRVAQRVASAVAACVLSASPPLVAMMPLPSLAARPQNAASSAGSRVNKDPESLLRNGLPISGPGEREARKLQSSVEAIKDDLKAKRVAAASGDVETAKRLVSASASALVGAAPTAERKADVESRLALMKDELEPIGAALKSLGPAGSPQEREALDEAGLRQANAARLVTEIENRLVPLNYKANVPVDKDFPDVPRLDGRARVAFTLKKAGGAKFDVEGELFDRANIELVVDGYTAPLTSGNFLDLVNKKFYDGMPIQRSDGFVIQTGDPDGEDGPKVGFETSKGVVRRVPLEISLAADKQNPLYGATTEDIGKGATPVSLPFQAYGALGMARDEYEADSASSQFFWLLFDSDLTPAGKNFLDGRYSAFGYTVKGEDFLSDVAVGDLIEKATVVRAPPPFGDYDGLDV